jgi:pyruvate dehydrogenase E2 component (dihydrolipoamide acetyltransferase)
MRLSSCAVVSLLAFVIGCSSAGEGSGAPSAEAPGGTPAASVRPAVTSTAAATSAATPAPPATDAPRPAASGGSRPGVSFNIQDAGAQTVLDAVGTIAGHAVQIDPAAEPYVKCAKVSIRTEEPIPPAELIDRVAVMLRPWGLIVKDTGTILTVAKAPDAPATPCAKR